MSLSMVLPLSFGTVGFESFSDEAIAEAIQQNLRMLLLTASGEYTMDANFGVGLRDYLFQMASDDLIFQIESDILKQSRIYMPYIDIKKVDINLEDMDFNIMSLKISYNIPQNALNQVLEMSVSP